MNDVDQEIVKRLQTHPWPELTLCGVSAVERLAAGPRSRVVGLSLQLAVCAPAADSLELVMDVGEHNAVVAFDWIRTFARGAIPVGWGAQSKTALHAFAAQHRIVGDASLCFVLRPKSRWLDPMIWLRVRTGKFHDLETVINKPSGNRGLDLVRLIRHLPSRPRFNPRADWTTRDVAEWQDLQRIF